MIYDLTYYFCGRFLRHGDRTVDQMVQAARSGKQNIAEGVAASSTAAETEIRLVNVAKASLKELLVDYEDFLRTRGLSVWSEKGGEVEWLRKFARDHEDSSAYLEIAGRRDAGTIANMVIVLLRQEDYLLFRQLQALERDFGATGDLKVRMKESSTETRARRHDEEMKAAANYGKHCQKCGELMIESVMVSGVTRLAWECRGCGLKIPADGLEFMEVHRERNRRINRVKLIFGY